MTDKFSGEDSGRQEWWRRCRTTGMDTAVEEMWDGKDEMWDNGDGEMGWKDSNGLGKY